MATPRLIKTNITKLAGRKPRPSGRKRAVQPALPGTEDGQPKMSAALKKLLPQVDEAIHEAGTWKQTENDLKSNIQELMSTEGLLVVELPRGGKLKYRPGHASLAYLPPKKKAIEGAQTDEGDSESDEE